MKTNAQLREEAAAKQAETNKLTGLELDQRQKITQGYQSDIDLYQKYVDAKIDGYEKYAAAVPVLEKKKNDDLARYDLEALARIPGMYGKQIELVRANLARELALHADNAEAVVALKRNAAATAAAGAIQVGVIESNRPTMAQGGFVPGNSYAGDRVPIQVNSGEAVLNASQQRNFMALANGALPQVRGPAQLSGGGGGAGIGAMQASETDTAPAPVVERPTVMTANFYDSRMNVTEEIRAAIRSGEFIPVMREALQAAGA